MHSEHCKSLDALFATRVDGNIEWSRIEALFVAVGCRAIEGSGSTVTFEKDGKKAPFIARTRDKEALKYRVRLAREYLQQLGINP